MFEYLNESLKKYVTHHHVAHIENNGSRCWKEIIKESKLSPRPSINVVFSRYQHTEVSTTTIADYGIVVALPSYWIDVDPELLVIYVSQYIDPWLKQYFGYNTSSGSTNNGASGNGNNNNCDCNGMHKPPLPGTMPPPPPHHHPHPGHRPPAPPPVIEIHPEDPFKHGYPVAPGE